MNVKTIKFGFIASALMNFSGVLILSRGFTNEAINIIDPVVMSNFGLLMIVIWGLAFLGASMITSNVKWLAAAFAVEKLVYVISWLTWFSPDKLTHAYELDLFAGIFYSIYGLNDFVFMLFFALLFWDQRKTAA
ncbi:hypothetical protein [Photobacterium damselae]|uniref:hypothetical protein n=1 Tax=Photobacterium damselae TaxID=38293 RepID=UPI000E051CF0|nr:hypothetical protein [Photobacterium damselae]SUB90589.1 Uncharacterised protein [Photobacterium damselae]